MLRLASSTVVSNALRAIASSRIVSGSISSVLSDSQDSIVKREIGRNCNSHHFSTDAKKSIDREFVKILKSEIKSKQLSLEKTMPAAPADFPFTIQDDPSESEITLTREVDGEKIDVVVYPLRNLPEDDEEESEFSGTDISDGGDDESSSTDSEENEKSSDDLAPSVGLGLYVNITKGNGKRLDLAVYASPHRIKIGAMSIKEPAADSDDTVTCFGEYLVDQDSDLEFALREFVEYRGMKKCYVGFLYEYMVRKSKLDPMLVLKKLKKFIKE